MVHVSYATNSFVLGKIFGHRAKDLLLKGQILSNLSGVHGVLLNPRYWNDGISGWLEDESPPWKLLVPLWRPQLS